MKPSAFILHASVWAFALVASFPARAGQCLSLGNGNWNNAATWSCGHVPVGGDTVVIQAGHTVSVTQNHVYNGLPLHIRVYGVWYFSGGGSKITLPCGSHVEIMQGGLLQPNSNSGGHSETVRICGITYWYYDQGPQAGYQLWPADPLPIELIGFDAEVSGNDVEITWSTASESGTDRFELQVGTDPSARQLLATHPAQGNSFTPTYYRHTDMRRNPGLWYYGLVEVDQRGGRHEHGLLSVSIKRSNHMTCTPDPVRQGYLLLFSSLDFEEPGIAIRSIDLRTVLQVQAYSVSSELLAVDISELSPGVYLASISTGGEAGPTCKFVVE